MSTTTTDPEEVVITHEVVEKPLSLARRLVLGSVLIVLGLVCLQVLGLALKPEARSDLTLGPVALMVSARVLGIVLGIAVLLLGVYLIARGVRRKHVPWLLAAAFLLFMIAFLSWVSTQGEAVNVVGLLQITMSYAVPLILGALAGVLCERSGVINVAIEGQMLAGAFAGALFGTLMGNYVGLVFAAVAGGLIGAMLAVFSIKYLVNQVVLGVVINVFALGLTGFFYNAFMQTDTQKLNSPGVLANFDIPLLSKIPILGPVLFQANLIVYLTYVLIIVVDVALFRSQWGLRTRAVGEHPKAADTVGINVLRVRYRNVVMGGAIAGLGGATYTIGQVGGFSQNITSGNGFIALAALIFGRWSPRGAVLAALLFGFASALQNMLSINVPGIPSNVLAMLPYVATILAVAGLVGKVRAPAADGEPYVKG